MRGAFLTLLRVDVQLRTLLVAAVLSFAACSATYTNHGYVPAPDELAQIEIGASRDRVAEIVGTPGVAGVMRDEAWFFTQYQVRNFTYNPPRVIERDIVAISFNEAGRVSNIERFGLQDGQIIRLSRRVTESSVSDSGFLRQILSNFGRIDLGNVLGN